jgi:hypothetical protein
MDSDRLLKRVWLINGFLVLVAAAAAVLGMSLALASELRDRGDPAVRVHEGGGEGGARPRAIRFDPPSRVRGSSTEVALIYHGQSDQVAMAPVSGTSYASSRSGQGVLVNVVFIDSGKPAGRLLLDRPAYLEEVRFPHATDRSAADSLQTWISYEIALADTNGDGTLDDDDEASLYVSALDGTGFRRVTPDGLDVIHHWMRPDRRSILVMGLQEPGDGRRVPREQLRQRAFVYDVPSGKLTAWSALEEPAARAARVVGR